MKSMIGIVLAFALGFACRAFGIPSPAPPLVLGALLVMTITIGYILLAIIVSTVIGMIAGIYPAFRAAKLDPILALTQAT